MSNRSYYFLLLPIFYIWHICNEYFFLLPLRYILGFTCTYLLFSFALFLISKLFLKNNLKSAVWSSTVLLVLLFWGAGHDFLRKLKLSHFFTSYSFLLSGVFLFFCLFTWQLKKSKSSLLKITSFANWLFIIFIILEALISLGSIVAKERKKNDYAYKNYLLPIDVNDTAGLIKPDIFFIVFDEYMSSAGLEKYLHFHNKQLDTILESNGFLISTNSKANYNSTPFSLGSSLNLQYFNIELATKKMTPKVMLQGQLSFKLSFLPLFLKKLNYQVLNYGILDLAEKNAPAKEYFQNKYINVFYEETLWNRMTRELWWHISTRLPEDIANGPFQKRQNEVIERNVQNFNSVLQELNTQNNTPKFVYSHFMLPHRPYYVDKIGKPRKSIEYYNDLSRDSLYLEQIIFANTWIDSLAKAANKSFNRPRVIIIEGDHGYRDSYLSDDSNIQDIKFMNLNAYYFSDGDYRQLYDSISPVNSFRVVLNKYFKTNLPLLKDSTILLH
jgi:Sulfatase